ncbi:MAG: hypothetical protein NTV46_13190 [Verrucomicrobia bacterium]|nr:hypothetical protein [Verrucomicrobiota bacterium]
MASALSNLRSVLLGCTLCAAQIALSAAADAVRIVFMNGKSIPITAVARKGDDFVVIAATELFNEGQTIPLGQADHVYGEAPPELKQAVALLLMEKTSDAKKLLEPLVSQHRITAKIPGNYWLEAARALLVACAVGGDARKCTELGIEISEATPAAGNDPFVKLGKALLMPATLKPEERETALADLTTDKNMPADVCAYASFYRANFVRQDKRDEKRNAKALEAYLMVPCLFPSGGLVIMAAAEIKAAELLNAPARREESLALLRSAVRGAAGTPLAEEASKRLKSLQ